MRAPVLLATTVAATAVLVGGMAIAQTEPETITACAKKPGGALRYSTNGTCKADETKLTWPDATDGVGIQGYELVSREVPVGSPAGGYLAGVALFCPEGKKVMEGGTQFLDDEGNPMLTSTIYVLREELIEDGRGYMPYIRGETTTSAETIN